MLDQGENIENWMKKFIIPWELMPINMIKALDAKERLSESHIRQLVRILAVIIRRYELKPCQEQIAFVVNKAVIDYPNTFQEKDDNGDVVRDLSEILCYMTKERIDYILSDSLNLDHPNVIPTDVDCGWLQSYEIPWDIMPKDLMTAIQHRQKPNKNDRQQMIRIIVASLREYDIMPSRQQRVQVARMIIEQYPDSFEDRGPSGNCIGNGCETLILQMKNRVEHVNRNYTLRGALAKKRALATAVAQVDEANEVKESMSSMEASGK